MAVRFWHILSEEEVTSERLSMELSEREILYGSIHQSGAVELWICQSWGGQTRESYPPKRIRVENGSGALSAGQVSPGRGNGVR